MKRNINLGKITLLAGLLAMGLGGADYTQAKGDEQTKLFEPYAPKPSGATPDGWEIQILEGSQIENKTTLVNKREIKVTVPAYELIPSVGKEKITVLKDPGFEPSLATAQKNTIGAVLTQYSEKVNDLQEKLEKILGELEKGLGPDVPITTGSATAATLTGTNNAAPSASPSPSPTQEGDEKKTEAKPRKNAKGKTNPATR